LTSEARLAAKQAAPGRLRVTCFVPVALFSVATIIHTWPLATDPAHLVYENADVELNAWIVSWVAHQAPRNPMRLFDANTFHPDRGVLAFSEPLILPGLVAIGPRVLGASAVLTHNLLLMLGLLLTALAGSWVGERLSGDRIGGLFAGSVIAFGPHTLGRLAHLQAHWVFALPLSLLALDCLIRRKSVRAAVGLGVCVAVLAVTSGYGLTIAVVALAAGCLARVGEWWRDWRGVAGRLLVAVLLCLALAFPVVISYSSVMKEHGLTRDARIVAMGAALPTSFLSTWSRLHHGLWSHHFANVGGTYFPGVLAIGLAGLALVLSGGWRTPRARMLMAVAVAGAVVALGPTLPLPVYGLLQDVFPPMRSLREPNRFGSLVVLAVGLLAAIGIAALRQRVPARIGRALAVVLIAGAHAEAFCAPFGYRPFAGFSPVYARLAQEPHRASLAEFPFYSGDSDYLNAEYVMASTTHWTPLVNGYSGFATQAYERRARALKLFPEAEALVELRRLGVSHVIVHTARYSSRPGHQRRVVELLRRWEPEGVEKIAVGPSGEALLRFPPPHP